MAKLRGVIFDMDGLIFDTELLYYQATQIVADQMGIPYTKELYLAYVGSRMKKSGQLTMSGSTKPLAIK